jgi:acyl carrier protein
MDVEHRLRQFIVDTRRWREAPDALGSDYRLIDNDVLDSMGIFEMITFLEDDFGIVVEDDDLVPENFETIAAIAHLVAVRQSS